MRVAVYQLNKELAKSEVILIDEGKDLSTANAKLYEEVLNTETEWESLQEVVGALAVDGHPLYRGEPHHLCDVIVMDMCAATGMYLLAVGATALIILFQVMNHSKLLKRDSTHLLLVKLEYNDDIKERMRYFFGFYNFHRFKITSNTEKVSAEEAKATDGNQTASASKRVFVEAVIRPTQHCSVESIANFICKNPEIKSIERLEDL